MLPGDQSARADPRMSRHPVKLPVANRNAIPIQDSPPEYDPEQTPEPCGRYQTCVCGEMIVSADCLNWSHEDGSVECWSGSTATPYY